MGDAGRKGFARYLDQIEPDRVLEDELKMCLPPGSISRSPFIPLLAVFNKMRYTKSLLAGDEDHVS